MNRYNADYHDDPRRETEDEPGAYIELSERQKRVNKLGHDAVRSTLGKDPLYTDEEKVPFDSEMATHLAKLIENSDLDQARVKNHLLGMIESELTAGTITLQEAQGLRHFVYNTKGFSDEPTRPKDWIERQSNS